MSPLLRILGLLKSVFSPKLNALRGAGDANELENFSWDYAQILSQGRDDGIVFSGLSNNF